MKKVSVLCLVMVQFRSTQMYTASNRLEFFEMDLDNCKKIYNAVHIADFEQYQCCIDVKHKGLNIENLKSYLEIFE